MSEQGTQAFDYGSLLYGRNDIYSGIDEITADNVIEELNSVLVIHAKNYLAEDYLYWYRRGLQDIRYRQKEVRPEIKNIVTENHAAEIVDFKNGYFLTQPAYYIARNENRTTTKNVEKLNEYLYRSGKQQVDNEITDWFHTVGKAALYIEPNNDKNTPVNVYALDPRSAFVVYSLRPGNEPIMGVNIVTNDKKVTFDVYTKDKYFKISGGVTGIAITQYPNFFATAIKVEEERINVLGEIPIIEYRYNSVNMGSFETVLPLLNTINTVMSNRIDGVEQFIQSLAIAVNCEFEDEKTTANDIRKAGMLVLRSIGENKADFKILSEQLNQSETQVLVNYIYKQILTICGMPDTTKGGFSSSDTGAAVLARDGWFQADNIARNTEDEFKKSNRRFDKIFLDILRKKINLKLDITDFELQFVRNETANVQSKAQACQTLLAAGMSPILAFGKSGISNDPVADVEMSKPYLNMIWGDPFKEETVTNTNDNTVEKMPFTEGEANITESDNDNGENDTGGAV